MKNILSLCQNLSCVQEDIEENIARKRLLNANAHPSLMGI